MGLDYSPAVIPVWLDMNPSTVALSSVHSYAAQEQAIEVSGFNEGHVSILRNK